MIGHIYSRSRRRASRSIRNTKSSTESPRTEAANGLTGGELVARSGPNRANE
jgi:hypothetical protein